MSFINKFLFHFHDKSINQLLDQKKYKEFLNYLKIQKNKENLFYDLSLKYIQEIFSNYDEEALQNKIIWINSFDRDDTHYLVNFLDYYLKKISKEFDPIKNYEVEISKFKKKFKEIDLNILVNFSYFFQWMIINSSTNHKFIINNVPFFSTENNYNFTTSNLSQSYINLENNPFAVYKKIRDRNQNDQQVARNLFLNLDNQPSNETINNLPFKINKQGWNTFNKSWKDENVMNSLRGITIQKSDINNSPYEIFSEILMHLIQSGLNIDINYDLIESYVKIFPPEKNNLNFELSNKEVKFINNYIDKSNY